MNRRKSVRFLPEQPTVARMHMFVRGRLSSEVKGLVRDESYRGCSILFKSDPRIQQHLQGIIAVGQLPALQFRVAWVKELHSDYIRVGIEYLE
jgi:hypothetical protein